MSRRLAFLVALATCCSWRDLDVRRARRAKPADRRPGDEYLWPLAVVAMPVAVVAGFVDQRLLLGRAFDLILSGEDTIERPGRQGALRGALDDPSPLVLWHRPDADD